MEIDEESHKRGVDVSASSELPEKKLRTQKDPSWKYLSGASVLPHPEKRERGGEDAFFIGNDVFGVADGVSSWGKYGIDPGKFSKKLMSEANEATQETKDVLEILETAYAKTQNLQGSCTVCIVSFTGDRMDTLNLGDSGFIVYRDGAFPICSREQQHSFNCPFQLGTRSRDRPIDGEREIFQVQDGDIVVLFTDGMSANLYAEKIAEIIKSTSTGDNPQQIADQLAKEAFSISQDPKADVPFTQDAKQAGWKRKGGKEDDITVLVVCVHKSNAVEKKPLDETTPPLGR